MNGVHGASPISGHSHAFEHHARCVRGTDGPVGRPLCGHPVTQTDHTFGLSKPRLEALTDGIFAVAMTLLVIELKVPDRTGLDVARLAQALADQLPTFIAWIISFYVLAIFWFSHHRLFHHLRIVDAKLVWLNIFYLSFVSLMPFCSALVGRFGDVTFAQVFYSANMTLLSIGGLMKYRYVFHHPELWERPVAPGFYRAARMRTIGLMMVAVVAIGINLLVPAGGNAAFLLMIPISILSRRAEGAPN